MSYIVCMDLTANDQTPQFKLGAIGQDYQGYLGAGAGGEPAPRIVTDF